MATTPASRSIEWSPVIGGTLVACAVTLVLVPFGHALGLSFTNLNTDQVVTPHSLMAFGLWMLWTQLSSSIAGGYFAGRMIVNGDNTQAGELRDGAHGLLVWALSSLITALAIGAAAALAAMAANAGADVTEPAISEALAKKVAIISSFSLAASSIVSAVAAWFIAAIGGDHRDAKIDMSKHMRLRRKK